MSVATTYAEALYEASAEADALEAVAAGVGEFARAYRDSHELREVLVNPEIEPPRKRAVIDSLAQDAHPLVGNALKVLIDRGRIAELPEVAAAFGERVARAEKRLEVEAVTAIPLPDDLRERIIEQVSQKTGRSVTLSTSVDPDIVGGLVLRVGESVVDGSLRTRLHDLHRQLTTVSVDAAATAD